MLEHMPAWEYELWAAEFHNQPWDYEREDTRNAIHLSQFFNFHIPKGQRTVKAEDLMPFKPKRKTVQSGEELVAQRKARKP